MRPWAEDIFPPAYRIGWRKNTEVFFAAGFSRSGFVSSGSSGSLVIITASVTRRETAGSWNSFETDGFLLCVRVSKKSHSVDFSAKLGVDVTPVSAARRWELIGA